MPWAIRAAEPRDIARLEHIENTADALLIDMVGATDWPTAPTGESRASEPGFILVATDSPDGEAIGFVHVLELDGAAHLEQLSVLPEHGRQGLGRALVEAALIEVGARGHHLVTLRTFADVPWNAPFYASCGFIVTEPDTPFQLQLVETERRLGLELHGRRVQMTARTQSTTAATASISTS